MKLTKNTFQDIKLHFKIWHVFISSGARRHFDSARPGLLATV